MCSAQLRIVFEDERTRLSAYEKRVFPSYRSSGETDSPEG